MDSNKQLKEELIEKGYNVTEIGVEEDNPSYFIIDLKNTKNNILCQTQYIYPIQRLTPEGIVINYYC